MIAHASGTHLHETQQKTRQQHGKFSGVAFSSFATGGLFTMENQPTCAQTKTPMSWEMNVKMKFPTGIARTLR